VDEQRRVDAVGVVLSEVLLLADAETGSRRVPPPKVFEPGGWCMYAHDASVIGLLDGRGLRA
jgi:hypothetical protein